MSIRRKVAANSGNWLRPSRLLKVKPRADLTVRMLSSKCVARRRVSLDTAFALWWVGHFGAGWEKRAATLGLKSSRGGRPASHNGVAMNAPTTLLSLPDLDEKFSHFKRANTAKQWLPLLAVCSVTIWLVSIASSLWLPSGFTLTSVRYRRCVAQMKCQAASHPLASSRILILENSQAARFQLHPAHRTVFYTIA